MVNVQLYCPSTKKTVEEFFVSPFTTLEQFLPSVRLALNLKYAAIYTTEAKPITEPSTLQEDQRVLVAASATEVMLPHSPSEWVLYDGEEGDDVDPNVECYGLGWVELCDLDKCLHITSLNKQKPTTRNRMRITREYKLVEADIDALDSTTSTTSSVAEDEDHIEKCWGVAVEQFLPTSMKPAAAKSSSKSCDPSTLAVLSILAGFTQGQSRLVLEVLEEAVALRTEEDQGNDKDPILRKDDVLSAINIIYERAEALPAKLIKGKGAKGKGKGKRRPSKGTPKKLGAMSS
ncbi:uncharacterized protein J4E78_006623 [Alternaria triticimaculans]|uniref:uncharacterized protein n=1 Tax=Alternaria triticimaculans TaxID=297637 RepID=UPI0020C33A72|nr:uncharacterized protein J4E78_006623 [Alternaria triticimaculans]KAI4656732.1 hypothetical protein J4E78_006623 [Alternaria triticimaculans]